MPQNVRRHSFGFQGRTFVNGGGIVLIKDMLEARACKGLGTRIEEQLVRERSRRREWKATTPEGLS